MGRRSFEVGSDELFAIPVDEFIREFAVADHSITGYEYDGNFGDDDDLSDQTPGFVMGCHSIIVPTELPTIEP